MRHNKEEFMRTMKRVAAVALSVVVLMTSGVSAKSSSDGCAASEE